MSREIWGSEYDHPGWIAELGRGKYRHSFGGTGWLGSGVLDKELGPPTLLLTVDLSDPRLAELCGDAPRQGELPLFLYLNGILDSPARYVVNQGERSVRFTKARLMSDERIDINPRPLPYRRLKLRRMIEAEIPATEDRYWTACDTLCGRGGWLRIGGSPVWMQDPEKYRSRGRPMHYVASIGYDVTTPSPFLDEPDSLMFGEMAIYFFASADLSEVVVTMQST